MSRRDQLASVVALKNAAWRHPFNVRPVWNGLSKNWEGDIKPGLVNANDVTLSLNGQDVRLTDGARLPLTSFRAIGPDSTGTPEMADDGSISVSYEGVPEFFAVRGVANPPKTQVQDSSIVTSPGQEHTRLLRALDIVLNVDRPATSSQFTTGIGADGILAQYSVTSASSPSARPLAYLTTSPQFTPLPAPDPTDRFQGVWADAPLDQLLLATVYLLSPMDASLGSAPDQSWQPFVAHHVFWNLAHGLSSLDPPLQNDNLTLNTGLAPGTGADALFNSLLALSNDADSQLAQFLNRNTIQGIFWTA
jgi:hypothetical protein